jgi:hypothetical protein
MAIPNGNYVKFYRGSTEAFKKAVKNADTLYFITDSPTDGTGRLYLGETLIAQGSQNEVLGISQLSDVIITSPLDSNHILFHQN